MILFIVSCSDHYKPSHDLTKNIVQAYNTQIVLHNTGCIKKKDANRILRAMLHPLLEVTYTSL